ncbi:MAG: hypothetical protein CVU97_06500 [Firmicutes bacterium HGW-Firmicutes-21]|nr:MAG: hypothetical protein CVU97_06500 [Firmicutes bacterium HGW-Firmicutes-21]
MSKNKIVLLLIAFLIIIGSAVLTGCNKRAESLTSEDISKQTSTMSEVNASVVKVGDYVSFGSYHDEPILWRVVKVTDGKPLLWSVNILTAKCFDSSESGVASSGETNAQKYGSNLWSNSNIREWLNTAGSVEWSTQPPIKEAMWGNNDYDTEDGFLTDFSGYERGLIVSTERRIYNTDDELIETTQDMVFLASRNEIQNGGEWGFNSVIDRKKTPTEKAMENNKNEYPDFRLACWYYLCSQGTGNNAWQIHGVRDEGDFFVGAPYESYFGIAPALQISSSIPKEGNGTEEAPWIF